MKFRDKEPYGVGVHITYTWKKASPKSEHITNPYYYSFYTRLVDRKSCFYCPYGTSLRVSDMTMCDYWGIANYHKEFNISAGVSGLLINTDKAADILDHVRDQVQLSETKIKDLAQENNLKVGDEPSFKHEPKNRTAFFETLDREGWTAAEKKYLYNKTRLKLWLPTILPGRVKRVIKFILKK